MNTHIIKGFSQDLNRGKVIFDSRAELFVENEDQDKFLGEIAAMLLDGRAHNRDFIVDHTFRDPKQVPFITKAGQLYKPENFSKLMELEIPLIADFSIHAGSPPSIDVRVFASFSRPEEKDTFFVKNEKGEYSCFREYEKESRFESGSLKWKNFDNRDSFGKVFKIEGVSYIFGRIGARIEEEKEESPSYNHYEIEHYKEQLKFFEQLLLNAVEIEYFEDIAELPFKKRPVPNSIPEGFDPEESIENRLERIRKIRENITLESLLRKQDRS